VGRSAVADGSVFGVVRTVVAVAGSEAEVGVLAPQAEVSRRSPIKMIFFMLLFISQDELKCNLERMG